jgi:hypothetical protein
MSQAKQPRFHKEDRPTITASTSAAGPRGPVVCYYDKIKLGGYALLGCLMTGASVFCVTVNSLKAQIAGWTGVVFFGGAVLALIARMISFRPALVISDEGVCDTRWRVGTIPWCDIDEINAETLSTHGRTHSFVGITLHNEDFYRRKMPIHARLPSFLNRCMGFSRFIINCKGLDREIDDILFLLNSYRPKIDEAVQMPTKGTASS